MHGTVFRSAADFVGGLRWGARAILCLFLFGGQALAAGPLPLANGAAPEESELITVRMEAGVSLRSIAEKYLNDPDLWPIILRLNGLNDITEIASGQDILLPASQVRLAASALEASLAEIQRANEAGAQLFAPILIKAAIGFRDQAMVENKNGVFQQSISLSSKSITSAEAARTTSEQKRDVEAEARLSDRQGWVEGQKTSENGWSERDLDAVLNEQEKLRTLSASTAQVVFRDASRLRLNPNSQAVIQRMRDDPLKRKKEAQISLVEGDFYALLAPDSDRSKLEVNMANVDAKIESGNFWVSQDSSGAKFSNYDAKPVEIVSGDDTLVLGRNEGAVVRTGTAPADKVDVIGRVALSAPDDSAIVFGGHVKLDWQGIDGGEAYWVEIAFDPRFDRMAESRSDIKETSTGELALAPGVYFWRVAALDALGLPGQMSTARRFEIVDDDTPPFLQMRTPDAGALLREAAVTISGETEAGGAVFVNGQVADVDMQGRFFFTLQAVEGANEATVIARDPAGNETVRRLPFSYIKDADRDIVYDGRIPRDMTGRFLSASPELSLSGTVTPEAKVAVLDEKGAVRSETYADLAGHFALNVPLAARQESFVVRVTTRSGYSYQEAITAGISDQPPRFKLVEPLPAITSRPALQLVIAADPDASLTVNGAPVTVDSGIARFQMDLVQGVNLVEIVGANPIGLVTIEKHTVLFDGDKPELTDRQVTAENHGDMDTLSIRIGARDASGLALTSRLRVRSGTDERVQVLRYNKAQRAYLGSLQFPRQPEGSKFAIAVQLADIAGNVNDVEFVE